MKFQWIRQSCAEFPVKQLCKTLGVSRAGYYAWCRRPESERSRANQALVSRIRVIHGKSRQTYGSPRVHDALKKDGVSCGRHRVARLMRSASIVSVHRRRFKPQCTNSSHDYPVAENVLGQEFSASRPNQKWVGDITYIWTAEGWLYLAIILDLFSRKAVGWAASSRPDAELACRALDMAVFRRGRPSDLVYHSDRGVQYASFAFRRRLQSLGMTPSMSRRGNCYDNAVAESFFHTLKVEWIHRYRYATRSAARVMVADYIEEFYNTNRGHSSIGNFSPVEYEEAHRFVA